MSDSVCNLYTLDTGGYDGRIGDQTDVVAEAGAAGDRADSQIDISAYDVG